MDPQAYLETGTLYTEGEIRQSRLWCRSIARRTAGNFYYSFLALSGEQFHGMCALYAFMRMTDDLGDDPKLSIPERTKNLSEWGLKLDKLTKERLDVHCVWPALHDTLRKFAIRTEDLQAVVDGVRMDLLPVEMRTFEDLKLYCHHVAGSVGFSCLRIWGTNSPGADELAIDCGLAFQLTNILRDLKEDCRLGRVYLPAEDLDRFGYSRQELEQGVRNDSFRQLMLFEVDRAKEFYRSAERLESHLPEKSRPVLRTMIRIYRELLHEIERRNFDVFSGRIRLSAWVKSRIVMSELLRGRRHR